MTLRSTALALAALLAVLLATTGCEDDITADDGTPSIGEFIEASTGARSLYANGVSTNLRRFRLADQAEVLADPRRRLRGLVPVGVANAVDRGQASSSYDTTAGEWTIVGQATSGDTLSFTYEGRIAYFDTVGRAMRDVVDGVTLTGTMNESFELLFRTGDFDSLASWDVRLAMDSAVDVLLGGTTPSPADTFFVSSEASLFRDALAPGDTSRIDFAATFGGRIGPRLENTSQCLTPTQLFDGRWNGLEATMNVSSGGFRISWYDPDEAIQDFQRILFEQTLEISCP